MDKKDWHVLFTWIAVVVWIFLSSEPYSRLCLKQRICMLLINASQGCRGALYESGLDCNKKLRILSSPKCSRKTGTVGWCTAKNLEGRKFLLRTRAKTLFLPSALQGWVMGMLNLVGIRAIIEGGTRRTLVYECWWHLATLERPLYSVTLGENLFSIIQISLQLAIGNITVQQPAVCPRKRSEAAQRSAAQYCVMGYQLQTQDYTMVRFGLAQLTHQSNLMEAKKQRVLQEMTYRTAPFYKACTQSATNWLVWKRTLVQSAARQIGVVWSADCQLAHQQNHRMECGEGIILWQTERV